MEKLGIVTEASKTAHHSSIRITLEQNSYAQLETEPLPQEVEDSGHRASLEVVIRCCSLVMEWWS